MDGKLEACGVILAGGRSSRMGRNKALLMLDGETLIARLARRFSAWFRQVVIVTNTPEEYGFLGIPMVSDRIPGLGPLAGLEAGLQASRYEHAFFCVVDMPFVDESLVRFMVEAAPGYDIVVPAPDGEYEPMHAVYGRGCLPSIARNLDARRLRLVSIFPEVRVREIGGAELAAIRRSRAPVLQLQHARRPGAGTPLAGGRRSISLRQPSALWISLSSLTLVAAAALLLPLEFPAKGEPLPPPGAALLPVAVIALLVWLAQPWRVAIRGARGDISISMAIDVAAMLLFHPFIAALGSAVGTAFYHLAGVPFTRRVPREHRLPRALIRGVVTFAAVALGSWAARMIRPAAGPIVFTADWLALFVGISIRLLVRIIFYPLGMAALRQGPVWAYLRKEWERLPLVPFLLTTTLGGTAALIYQYQPAALVLLFGPLASTWALSQEFHRMNRLLDTLEDKIADRTARLAHTVTALERRLAESEALHAVDEAITTAIHPDEVLTVIARESVRVTGGSSALITLLTSDGSRQFVRATYGAGDGGVRRPGAAHGGQPDQPGAADRQAPRLARPRTGPPPEPGPGAGRAVAGRHRGADPDQAPHAGRAGGGQPAARAV